MGQVQEKTELLNYDQQFVITNANDVQRIIHPVWVSVDISSVSEYENTLKPFSIPQRYVFAMQWYFAEVYNGGHCQFYSNSTGIVWEDALAGFNAIGATKCAEILQSSTEPFGGEPSKCRANRNDIMDYDNFNNEALDTLDLALYAVDDEFYCLAEKYIQANARDFCFAGEVISYL